MPRTHVDEEIALLIAEALHAGWTYSQIKKAGFTNSDKSVSLIKTEMQVGNIIIDEEGRAEIRDWEVVRHKDGRDSTKESKTAVPSDDEKHVLELGGLNAPKGGPRETGTVRTTSIIEKQSTYLAKQMNVVLAVGEHAVEMMRKVVNLTKEQMDDPELQALAYIHHLNASKMLVTDTHAFERLEIEFALVGTHLDEAYKQVTTMTNGFDTAIGVMGRQCRDKLYYALVLKAKAEAG